MFMKPPSEPWESWDPQEGGEQRRELGTMATQEGKPQVEQLEGQGEAWAQYWFVHVFLRLCYQIYVKSPTEQVVQ